MAAFRPAITFGGRTTWGLFALWTALAACSSDGTPSTDAPACESDTDCATGEFCDVTECVAECPAARARCGTACCPAGALCGPDGCLQPADCSTEVCGSACCGAGEICAGDTCRVPCPNPLCGTACCESTATCVGGTTCCPNDKACGNACCGDAEACIAGACVTLGAACDPAQAGCATRVDATGCPLGETCDAAFQRCVPDLADPSCTFTPPVGEFDPVPLFTWGQRRARACTDAATDCQTAEVCQNGQCTVTWPHVTPAADDFPDHFQVTSIPIVADLDDDCVPEIIFNTFKDSDFRSDGILRAIRGDTGAKVWTASAAAYRTDGTANPAVGDLQGDGELEIFVASEADNRILAFDARGRPLWTSDAYSGNEDSGSVTIANVDGMGPAEVVFGAAVYDVDGHLVFEGDEGVGLGGQGPIACVADLDGDDRPELVAGRTAYQFTGAVADDSLAGSVRFTAETPDGYCGIADLDGDRAPEVVLVASGTVYVLQGQTGAILASLEIPGGGHGGAPNIADFDGDAQPEIATAGASQYVVMRYDGPDALVAVWSAPTEDDSSSRTGSSVFDFDGDGRAEVVYNDEEFVRIYPGREPDCRLAPPGPGCDGNMTDAEILFRDLNSSRTRTEYPVIADVDGDFKAEIVFATSNEADFLDPALLGDAGIEVWRDRLDNWVGTPAVWNQHAYHITNVSVPGRIPTVEPASWLTPADAPFNSYRRNAQGDRAVQCAPDLLVESIRQRAERCATLRLEADVVNRGCLGVGPGVVVELRNADGTVIATATTAVAIPPGQRRVIAFEVDNLGADFELDVVLVVDADAALNECEETNNTSTSVNVACRTEL